MKLYEMARPLEEEPFKRQEMGFGMSEYANSNFTLSGGTRSGSSPEGLTRLKYEIYDMALYNETGDVEKSHVGYTELFLRDEDQTIQGLVNIELKPKFRKSGRGRQIMKDLKDTVEGADIEIRDVQKKAKGFWDKVGIEYPSSRRPGQGGSVSGKI